VNVEHFRRRLLDLERELVERHAREVESARSAIPDQAAAGDLALADEAKDDSFALAQTDSAILAQVRAALGRIDAGTFGRCVVDGAEIEPQRLEAVPWTPYCLKHEQELEDRLPKRTPSM
jgi:RNA polymerase-binding transcription factor DksA